MGDGFTWQDGERTIRFLADHGVLASVGSVGDAYDNALAESFVDSFKTELIADRVWRTRSQLELAVVEYIGWFNHTRLHEALGDIPPAEMEPLYAPLVEINTSLEMKRGSPTNPVSVKAGPAQTAFGTSRGTTASAARGESSSRSIRGRPMRAWTASGFRSRGDAGERSPRSAALVLSWMSSSGRSLIRAARSSTSGPCVASARICGVVSSAPGRIRNLCLLFRRQGEKRAESARVPRGVDLLPGIAARSSVALTPDPEEVSHAARSPERRGRPDPRTRSGQHSRSHLQGDRSEPRRGAPASHGRPPARACGRVPRCRPEVAPAARPLAAHRGCLTVDRRRGVRHRAPCPRRRGHRAGEPGAASRDRRPPHGRAARSRPPSVADRCRRCDDRRVDGPHLAYPSLPGRRHDCDAARRPALVVEHAGRGTRSGERLAASAGTGRRLTLGLVCGGRSRTGGPPRAFARRPGARRRAGEAARARGGGGGETGPRPPPAGDAPPPRP